MSRQEFIKVVISQLHSPQSLSQQSCDCKKLVAEPWAVAAQACESRPITADWLVRKRDSKTEHSEGWEGFIISTFYI